MDKNVINNNFCPVYYIYECVRRDMYRHAIPVSILSVELAQNTKSIIPNRHLIQYDYITIITYSAFIIVKLIVFFVVYDFNDNYHLLFIIFLSYEL